jgi:hypothetical protein
MHKTSMIWIGNMSTYVKKEVCSSLPVKSHSYLANHSPLQGSNITISTNHFTEWKIILKSDNEFSFSTFLHLLICLFETTFQNVFKQHHQLHREWVTMCIITPFTLKSDYIKWTLLIKCFVGIETCNVLNDKAVCSIENSNKV